MNVYTAFDPLVANMCHIVRFALLFALPSHGLECDK